MSTPAVAPSATPILCHGNDIGYKAFARRLTPTADIAVLILIANCYFDNSGYTISIQSTANGFELLEQPPSGIFHDLVSYCMATWTSPGLIDVPAHVMITDAFGTHKVHVENW